jgi:hypothetical protein
MCYDYEPAAPTDYARPYVGRTTCFVLYCLQLPYTNTGGHTLTHTLYLFAPDSGAPRLTVVDGVLVAVGYRNADTKKKR